MQIRTAERLTKLPPYLFAEIDRAKRAARAAGKDVIDFGVGDPDQPTLPFIVDRMAEEIRNAANHPYPPGKGTAEFRQAVGRFMRRRFGVEVDPDREVLALIGTKEGIGHLATALVDPGDAVLVPDPGYPVYTSGTIFAGGEPVIMPLRADRGWLPSLDEIPSDVARRAKILWLNYPNNPTGATATLSFFEQAVAFAREYGIVLAQDAAYSEVYFDQPPPSILQVPGAKEVAVEFHSLSKTFNMTGWRIGFAVGQPDVIAALASVKSNLDSGVFAAIQAAGIAALDGSGREEVRRQMDIYRRRREALIDGLSEIGWKVKPPAATFYVWVQCPNQPDSMAFAKRLLAEANVVVIPGIGFGQSAEGYVRFALTVSEDRTKEAIDRIRVL